MVNRIILRLLEQGSIGVLLIGSLINLFSIPAYAMDGGDDRPGMVTESRVINESKLGHNWLVNGGTFGGEHYSPLDEINDANVNSLGLAWSLDLPSTMGIQAEPIVVDGIAYLTANLNIVYAIDASNGRILWEFDPKLRLELAKGPSYAARINRGVAVWEGVIYLGAADCRLIAIDAAQGKKLWESSVCDPEQGGGAYITAAPRVGGGMVFSGYGGSEWGVWGSLVAFDAKTGEERWRFWTLPRDPMLGDKGKGRDIATKTWTRGWAREAGATVWEGIRYDPVTGLVIFGTSAPGNMDARARDSQERDNLFGSSVLAVDAKTGEYVWHYQVNPADAWNYDANMPKIVTDVELDGKSRRILFEAGKNGFLYLIDARSGEVLAADPIVDLTWASHVDLGTGRPVELPDQRFYKLEDPAQVIRLVPTAAGARGVQSMSYSPKTNLLYLPVAQTAEYITGGGGEAAQAGVHVGSIAPGALGGPDLKGWLAAWDPVKNRESWRVKHVLPFNGGVMSTAGNLVFTGTATGEVQAYSADAGRLLWSYQTGSAITANPVSYSINGEQYLLIPVGAGGGVAMAAWDLVAGPEARGPARLVAFKLGGKAELSAAVQDVQAVPKPPEQQATAALITRGEELYYTADCVLCHGMGAAGRGARVLDGAVPDLRYMTPEAHAEWTAIVAGGSRHKKGMLKFIDDMTYEDSKALHAFVIEQAWEAYNAQQNQSP